MVNIAMQAAMYVSVTTARTIISAVTMCWAFWIQALGIPDPCTGNSERGTGHNLQVAFLKDQSCSVREQTTLCAL